MRMVLEIDIQVYSEEDVCQVFFLERIYDKKSTADINVYYKQGMHKINLL